MTMRARKTMQLPSTASAAAMPPKSGTRRGASPGTAAHATVKPSRKAATTIPAPEPAKTKQKVVRDSFTFPKDDYDKLLALKQRAVALARPAKKGELIRAGIAWLTALDDPAFLAAISAVPSVKTGRPKREKQNPGQTRAR